MDTRESPCAVLFESELSFQGVDDGLDPLPSLGEFPEPGFLVPVVGPRLQDTEPLGEEALKFASGETLAA